MRYELLSTLNAAVMRRFERVVALPDPKNCVLPSRINSLEVAQPSRTPPRRNSKVQSVRLAFLNLYCAAGLKIRGEGKADKS